jgi:hypothetical protein
MSDRLTFLWFPDTCNLGQPTRGSQEALWNRVYDNIKSEELQKMLKTIGFSSPDLLLSTMPKWSEIVPFK